MKTCLNCGSPIHGYRDFCGGLACNASMSSDNEINDWEAFKRMWPSAAWHLWQVILALQWMRRECPELSQEEFSGSLSFLAHLFEKMEDMG